MSVPYNITSLSPEVLLNIVVYLSDRRDFVAFTSTCRLLRSFFTATVRASCSITKHGKDLALKVREPYGREILRGGPMWYKREIKESPAYYKFKDHEVVRELVRRGCSIDVKPHTQIYGDCNNWLLAWATATQDVELVRMLIERGAKDNGEALDQAAQVGNADLVRILRDEAGGDVYYEDNHPMINAVAMGHAEVVEALLENGVVITERGAFYEDLESFLQLAAPYGVSFVKLLVDRGVITIRNGEDEDEKNTAALYFAVEKGDVELMKYLLENGIEPDEEIDFPDLALKQGHLEIHNVLIKHAIDVEDDKEELMVKAVKTNFHGLLEELIKLGVNVEEVDRKSRENCAKGLLELALTENSHRVVPILLKTLDCPDKLIMTAMEEEGKKRVKSRENRTEIVKALLSHKGENTSIRKGTLLSLATEQANADLVSYLLESDSSLHVPDQSIITAAEKSQTGLVKALLKGNGKSSTIRRDSLLRIATSSGNGDLVAFLFETANDEQRQSLLACSDELVMAAAKDGHTKIVEPILKNKGGSAVQWDTLLGIAASSGNTDMVALLFETADDDQRKSLLACSDELVIAAAKDGHTEIVELFFHNMGRNVDALRGQILTVAAISGYENVVKFLLKNDTVYQNTTMREEALVAMLSSRECRPRKKIVLHLLDAGADLHFDNEKPLAEACKRRRLDLVKLFIEKGADANVGNGALLIDIAPALYTKSKTTWKINNETKVIFKELLESGANINVNEGQLLIDACAAGHLELVRFLLGAGADVHSRNDEALDVAAKGGHKEVLQLIRRSGGKVDPKLLIDACAAGDLEQVQKLLRAGANVHAERGHALVVAARGGHNKVVAALLNAGVNIDESLKGTDVMEFVNGYYEVWRLLNEPKRASKGKGNHWGCNLGHSGNSNNAGGNSSKRKRQGHGQSQDSGNPSMGQTPGQPVEPVPYAPSSFPPGQSWGQPVGPVPYAPSGAPNRQPWGQPGGPVPYAPSGSSSGQPWGQTVGPVPYAPSGSSSGQPWGQWGQSSGPPTQPPSQWMG
ncbi:hypothetical protein HK102_012124 [Quaeritorhiza haematococci]|nr:hypothetical protein HK102_012124 [Quaeritorhiza haematococci]